jgi:hypothetical protein
MLNKEAGNNLELYSVKGLYYSPLNLMVGNSLAKCARIPLWSLINEILCFQNLPSHVSHGTQYRSPPFSFPSQSSHRVLFYCPSMPPVKIKTLKDSKRGSMVRDACLQSLRLHTLYCFQVKNSPSMFHYIYIYIYIQGVPGVTDQNSGGCSFC